MLEENELQTRATSRFIKYSLSLPDEQIVVNRFSRLSSNGCESLSSSVPEHDDKDTSL